MVDPLGGSYYVEKLTEDLADKAWALIEEVEALGGMTKAVESGMPKLRIEESAARRQARVDRGEEVIVGVNKYRTDEAGHGRRPRHRQHDGPRAADRTARAGVRARPATWQASIRRAEAGARGDGNLLALCVDAARARATVGEMSDAMERVFGRHRAEIR